MTNWAHLRRPCGSRGRPRSTKPRYPSGRVKGGAEPNRGPVDEQTQADQDWWLEQATKHADKLG